MKMEKFGWFAERAPVIPALPKVDGSLEFLVKAEDSSTLQPAQEIVESYHQNDGLEKLFALEPPERRSHPSVEYEQMVKAIYGNENVAIMDVRSNEPIAAPLQKGAGATTTTSETIGTARWTYFHRNGELVRMRCVDEMGEVEFDGQGNVIAA
jgi:hypothetical protein